MKYFKILDRIEATIKNKAFNPAMDIVKFVNVPAGKELHPFNGDVYSYEAYIKEVKTTHEQRLTALWEKVRDYATFECKYDPN